MDPTHPSLAIDQSYDNAVTLSGYPPDSLTTSEPAGTPPIDVAALLAANQELNAMIHNMRIGYNAEMQAEMDVFCAAVKDDFAAMAATIARLEHLERPQNSPTPERTRDPRVKPRSSTATESSTATSSKVAPAKSPRTNTEKTKGKQAPATPEPAKQPKAPSRSRISKESESRRSSKPPRSSPQAAPAFATPPRPSPKQPGSSSTTSASSKKSGASAKNSTPRKLAEHQMLKGDIDPSAQSFKNTFQTHLRFLWGCLDSAQDPPSALKRVGQLGDPVISPSQVKLGISVEDSIRSKNRIVRAFFQLEEGALLHIKAYLAKLGIITWAVDFSQSPYSMYNSAMCMCAIDTFRFAIAGTYYDFLHSDTRYIKDSTLLVRLYDHFVHRYMYDNETKSLRIVFLHGLRAQYLAGTKVPEGIKLLFHPKATSDDESTSTGFQALARPERSQPADQIIRAVEGLMVEDLLHDGKTRAANNRKRRRVPPFGQRNTGYFQEIPKGMSIQYYDPSWYNNRPPQARAKIAPKLAVVFVPGSTDFFSRRSENTLPIDHLTQKYGAAVFAQYDLDFGPTDAAESEGINEASEADDEGEGDSVGSQDSDEDIELSDAGSMASFISHDNSASDDDQEYEEGDQQDAVPGDYEHTEHTEQNEDTAGGYKHAEQIENWDGMAQFAEAYDVDMRQLDDEQVIFGDGDSTDSDQ
ncbi:hypothetical protein C8R43DRAFT_1134711 [Mycena crocata]|nr:hypothetical protein C8R43DRAFT_1134711 [Mycena crocata]